MKIVLMGPAHPLRGGLASFNERLALELQSQGHEVRLYSFSYQYPSFLFPGKTQLTDAPAPAGLDIRTRMHSLWPLNWWSVGNEIAAWQPDKVVCRFWLPFMGPCLGSILRVVARKYPKAERIALIDNILPHEKRPGDKPLAQYFASSVNRFVAMAQSVAIDLKPFMSTNQSVSVTPHPIYDNYGNPMPKSEARKKLGLADAEKVLLFFGFIRKYKGLDLLISAMADTRVRALGVKLVVAGEFYSDSDSYLQLIEQLGLQNDIFLHTHFIAENEVAQYFSAADVAVQPYRSATQSGITQIAYHFGLPMIVSNVGGLPEMVPHGKAGLVVSPEAPAIASAIVDFFENDIAKQLRLGTLEEKEKYAWPRFVRVLLGE